MYLLSFLQVGKDILNSPFDFLYFRDVQQKESLKMLFFSKINIEFNAKYAPKIFIYFLGN